MNWIQTRTEILRLLNLLCCLLYCCSDRTRRYLRVRDTASGHTLTHCHWNQRLNQWHISRTLLRSCTNLPHALVTSCTNLPLRQNLLLLERAVLHCRTGARIMNMIIHSWHYLNLLGLKVWIPFRHHRRLMLTHTHTLTLLRLRQSTHTAARPTVAKTTLTSTTLTPLRTALRMTSLGTPASPQ